MKLMKHTTISRIFLNWFRYLRFRVFYDTLPFRVKFEIRFSDDLNFGAKTVSFQLLNQNTSEMS
jgi:hypothetical protein